MVCLNLFIYVFICLNLFCFSLLFVDVQFDNRMILECNGLRMALAGDTEISTGVLGQAILPPPLTVFKWALRFVCFLFIIYYWLLLFIVYFIVYFIIYFIVYFYYYYFVF
jgi:hypothetical protein